MKEKKINALGNKCIAIHDHATKSNKMISKRYHIILSLMSYYCKSLISSNGEHLCVTCFPIQKDVEAELKDNAAEQERRLGAVLVYGETVQVYTQWNSACITLQIIMFYEAFVSLF